MRAVKLLLAILALAGGGSGVHAEGGWREGPWIALHEGTRVRLLVGPSQAANAAIEVDLAHGWKTYWRTPGDAGVPPEFDWQASQNAASVTVLYPSPHRLSEPAAETIGYKGRVIFPVLAKPRDAAKPIALALDLQLGICKEICVPAEAHLTATIASASATTPLPSEIAQAVRAVPKAAGRGEAKSPAIVKLEADLAVAKPHLAVEGRFAGDPADADVFVEAPPGLYVPMLKRAEGNTPGTLRFEVSLAPALARDLRGKEVVVTLVSGEGATETRWTLP